MTATTTDYDGVTPMTVGSRWPLIDRAYREGRPFQWVREGVIANPIEAGATAIRYTVDAASFAAHGVFRGQIEDNGLGISFTDIPNFINRFGGGGKPIGDEHANFGVGYKSSALPWNRAGIVGRTLRDNVLSIFVLAAPAGGEVGLLKLPDYPEDPATTFVNVVTFDLSDAPELLTWVWRGVDWVASFPQWIIDTGHGTTFTHLGNTGTENTYFGDPKREIERASRYSIFDYCNRRIWELPKGVTLSIGTSGINPRAGESVEAQEGNLERFRLSIRKSLLGEQVAASYRHPGEAKAKKVPHWELRQVVGMLTGIHYFPKEVAPHSSVLSAEMMIGADNLPAKLTVYYKDTNGPRGGRSKSTDIVPIDEMLDGKDQKRGNRLFGFEHQRQSYVGALYRSGSGIEEVYDPQTAHRHRQFALIYPEIYRKVWISVEPQVHDADVAESIGVYPQTSRSKLLWDGAGGITAQDLPWAEWGREFRDRLAEIPWLVEILKAQSAGAGRSDEESNKVLKRVCAILDEIMRAIPLGRRKRNVLDPAGDPASWDTDGIPVNRRGPRRKRKKPVVPRKRKITLDPDGPLRAVEEEDPEDSGIPPYEWVSFKDRFPDVVADSRPVLPDGSIDYDPNSWCPDAFYYWDGITVWCNQDNSIYEQVIAYWVDMYDMTYEEDIIRVTQETYGSKGSSYTAHTLRSADDELRDLRLSVQWMSGIVYGLYGEHSILGQRLSGAITGKRKKAS